ncbi:Ankyrin-2 [Tetrabaena socialis]|uniref:Ankyrin-2 n=1 Tax=Tetrabaena socialis TaxID=47790 RepID=A0A2J7ZZY9_9CHLO|nr:Ankyrin-2 [Tetrabaena socialis]|eukprot:PNH05841.1 Ankyrin-2 [Tetrabaena socialis]
MDFLGTLGTAVKLAFQLRDQLRDLKDIKGDAELLSGQVGRVGELLKSLQEASAMIPPDNWTSPYTADALKAVETTLEEIAAYVGTLATKNFLVKLFTAGKYQGTAGVIIGSINAATRRLAVHLGELQLALGIEQHADLRVQFSQQHTHLQKHFHCVQSELQNVSAKLEVLQSFKREADRLQSRVEQLEQQRGTSCSSSSTWSCAGGGLSPASASASASSSAVLLLDLKACIQGAVHQAFLQQQGMAGAVGAEATPEVVKQLRVEIGSLRRAAGAAGTGFAADAAAASAEVEAGSMEHFLTLLDTAAGSSGNGTSGREHQQHQQQHQHSLLGPLMSSAPMLPMSGDSMGAGMSGLYTFASDMGQQSPWADPCTPVADIDHRQRHLSPSPDAALNRPVRRAQTSEEIKLLVAAKGGNMAGVPSAGDSINVQDADGYTLLHFAAVRGLLEPVEQLLQAGSAVGAQTENGYTPLHLAAMYDNAVVAEALLGYSANMEARSKDGKTPLHAACLASKLAVVEGLLRKGAKVDAKTKNGSTPLHISSGTNKAGAAAVVKVLLKYGAKADEKDEDWSAPLHVACRNSGAADNVAVVEALLQQGHATAELLDAAGSTPLHIAAQYGNVAAARALIRLGAKVDARRKDGLRPLHLAAWHNRTEAAQLLLEEGKAAVHKVDKADMDEATPLHVAAKYGSQEVVELLLAKGADFKVEDQDGLRPLHLAARENRRGTAEVLLLKGCKVDSCTRAGRTALEIAQSQKHTDLIVLLQDPRWTKSKLGSMGSFFSKKK